MKKTIYFIIVILLLAGGTLAQRTYRSPKNVTSSVTTAYINTGFPIGGATMGADFTVPVSISDTTGLGIIAYQFDLQYDPSVIQPKAIPVTAFGTLSSGMAVVYNPISPGSLKVAVYGALPLSGAGTLLNLNFKAVGADGSVSPLRWVNPMFNEGNPGVYPKDGQIRITAQPSNPTPVNFSGKETISGTLDALNQVFRNNSFVLASGSQINASSMNASFDMIPSDEAGKFKIVDGQWTVMVYENGLYVGSIYGSFFDGRVTDQIDGTTGTTTQRTIKSLFRIRGGIGRFENAGSEDAPSGEFTSTTDYTDGKKTTATLSYVL